MDHTTTAGQTTNEALPVPGIEVLRHIVERYDIYQRGMNDYHELHQAVFRLRVYIPGDQAMTALEVLQHIEEELQSKMVGGLRHAINAPAPPDADPGE